MEKIAAQTKPARADQLQFLRFLAFMNVFIWHAESMKFFDYPTLNCGTMAVTFFVVLSGLIVGYTSYGRKIAPTPKNIAKDMWKRIRKFYPLYALSMLIPAMYYAFPEWIAAGDWENVGYELTRLTRCLLLIQAWVVDNIYAFNIVGWYMSSLVFWNLFNLPVVHLLHKAEEKPKKFWIFILAIAFVSFLEYFYCGLTRGLFLRFWHCVFPPARLGEYFAGIILGFGIRSLSTTGIQEKIPASVYTVAEIAVLIFGWIYMHWWGTYWTTQAVHWLFPSLVVLFVFTFGRGLVSKVLRWKPLVYLGDISFECYLLHELVVQRYEVLHYNAIVSPLDQAVGFFYCLGVTILAASLFHRARK